MRIGIEDACTLMRRVMCAVGHTNADAALIADHLIDCELRGVQYGGLPRALSIAERMNRTGPPTGTIRVVKETPLSASIDGGDRIGYVVAYQAMQVAIAKASASGIALVGAYNTWYTGMLSYYAEMAAAQGLVSVIASNASPWVTPQGGTEGRFGTNPICVGFPSAGEPVIWDIGTSAIMHAEVMLAGRLGQPLPEGVAFDSAGRETRDPARALQGAFAAWGGHKGSGLGIVVQLLGAMAGSPAMPPDLAQFGMVIIAIRPDLLTDAEGFKQAVADYAESVRGSRPVEGGPPVRMPFDRSRAERDRRLAEGSIDVADSVYSRLSELARAATSG